ncbi:MAG: PAS domain-containing protein [Microthrixaceae bacterium]
MSIASDDGLRRALEAAGVAVATLDREGHALSANFAFAELISSSPDLIVGRHLVGMCHSDHAPSLTSALVRIIGRVSQAEVIDVVTDGRSPVPIRLTLALTPPRRNGDEVIFCIAVPVAEQDSTPGVDREHGQDGHEQHGHEQHGREQGERAVTSGRPLAPPVDDRRGDLAGAVLFAIERSGLSGNPFALLACGFGLSRNEPLLHGETLSSDSDQTSTASARSIGSTVDGEMKRIAVSRLDQRLRATDSIVIDDAGRIHVIAEDLGDKQDSAGVAYRLLSTMVEPFAVLGEKQFVVLTIGITVGDGRSDAHTMINGAVTALEAAVEHGVGGFNIIDLRLDHSDPP